MRNRAPKTIALVLLAGCGGSAPALPGLDVSKLTDAQRAALAQATADFGRAKAGLQPTCEATSVVGFSDGGSVSYDCPEYHLLVRKSLTIEDGKSGYIYGPVLTFDGHPPISDLRFYTQEEVDALIKKARNGR